jgi:small-conductance mechanosensitive channel/CRP-like cAMP-binding protein
MVQAATARAAWRSPLNAAFSALTAPVLLFFAVLALRSGWPRNAFDLGLLPVPRVAEQGALLLTALCWAAFAFLFNRLCSLVLWRGVLPRAGVQAPAMLVTLAEILVWLATIAIVIAGVYGQSVTALLATSTVLIGVAGFALQKMIADFFAGIALSIERPYAIGDWLQLDPGGPMGKVAEFSWRSTSIVTPEDLTIVIPNGRLAERAFTNYSRPHRYFRDKIRVTLPYDVTTHQGQRILLGAANQIDEIAGLPLKPVVTIDEYDTRGVAWVLIYAVPDRHRLIPLRFLVHQNILRNLHYAGIEIPVQAQEIRLSRTAPASDAAGSVVRLLRQSALFAGLTADETAELAQAATQHICYAGEPILTQGNPGSSLFILNEGLLGVRVSGTAGTDTQVAQIQPGEFFGELSLLTGEPRGATVIPVTDCLVTEIGKDAMSTLLQARPELAELLSDALAGRQAANRRSMAGNGPATAESEGLARQLLGRIRTFFNLGSRGG